MLESERLLQPRVAQGGSVNVNSYSAISQDEEDGLLANPFSGMSLSCLSFVFVLLTLQNATHDVITASLILFSFDY